MRGLQLRLLEGSQQLVGNFTGNGEGGVWPVAWSAGVGHWGKDTNHPEAPGISNIFPIKYSYPGRIDSQILHQNWVCSGIMVNRVCPYSAKN